MQLDGAVPLQGKIPFGAERPNLRHQAICHGPDRIDSGVELGHHFARIQEKHRDHRTARVNDNEVAHRLSVRVAQAGLKSPCLTIIGEVVKLHETLAWFKPLLKETVL